MLLLLLLLLLVMHQSLGLLLYLLKQFCSVILQVSRNAARSNVTS